MFEQTDHRPVSVPGNDASDTGRAIAAIGKERLNDALLRDPRPVAEPSATSAVIAAATRSMRGRGGKGSSLIDIVPVILSGGSGTRLWPLS
ncbi:sugar phosphate nucleotidyltransferase, partial [Sphingomonas sp. CCH9-F2]|uniref:sugar phosphate nucleotidyltransferase n=1 Tax=Sphingomonas sp. CCH9-F2 TaxID=1768778 RepID=UPI001E530D4F